MSTDRYSALCAELLKAIEGDVIDTNDGQRFQAVIDRVRAKLAQPEPQVVPPSGCAFRYPDGIRFNNGREVNGCYPSEAIP
jgi:hypothetical protein